MLLACVRERIMFVRERERDWCWSVMDGYNDHRTERQSERKGREGGRVGWRDHTCQPVTTATSASNVGERFLLLFFLVLFCFVCLRMSVLTGEI